AMAASCTWTLQTLAYKSSPAARSSSSFVVHERHFAQRRALRHGGGQGPPKAKPSGPPRANSRAVAARVTRPAGSPAVAGSASFARRGGLRPGMTQFLRRLVGNWTGTGRDRRSTWKKAARQTG